MARIKQLVIDCRHPAALARFWVAALDDTQMRAYDEAEVRRLAALGLTPETDPVVLVDGPMLELCFQRIVDQTSSKNRMHVDLSSGERDGEVARLVALGASVIETFPDHTWMRDPEGNDFCVTDDRAATSPSDAKFRSAPDRSR